MEKYIRNNYDDNDSNISEFVNSINAKDDKRHRRRIRRGSRVVCGKAYIKNIGIVKVKHEIDLDRGIEGVGDIMIRIFGKGKTK